MMICLSSVQIIVIQYFCAFPVLEESSRSFMRYIDKRTCGLPCLPHRLLSYTESGILGICGKGE